MKASRMICLGVLVIVSIADIKYRKIPVEILVIANFTAIMYQCMCHGEDVVMVVGGMAIGVVFLIVSRVTKEGVGYGDSLGILGMGIYVGLWKAFEILAGAFFLLTLCAIIALVRKKMSRKSTLPFYPFLTAAYIMWMIGEMGI